MDRYYRIAGLTVRMDSFGRTVAQAEPYRITPCGHVDILICGTWEAAAHRHPELSADMGEYLLTGKRFYQELLNFDGLMLHASAVVVGERAYLFTADCGTGKSTHTRLWLQQFGKDACILNDDKPALRLEDGIWYAYGTPWSGKDDISTNRRVRLGGIALLERSETNEIMPATGLDVVQTLMKQTIRPRTPERVVMYMELLDKLINGIPIWKLRCNMDPEAALISYSAMSKKGISL